jgi:hypothetical protein
MSTQWVPIEAMQADDVLFDQDSQSSWPVLSSLPHPAQHWRHLVAGEPGSRSLRRRPDRYMGTPSDPEI